MSVRQRNDRDVMGTMTRSKMGGDPVPGPGSDAAGRDA